MKLSCSNLAWPATDTVHALHWLADSGFTGVEVAPTRIAEWDHLTSAVVADYGARLVGAGLRASSLQAIFFGRPEAQLLGSPEAFVAMVEHVKRVTAVAYELGAGILVFGAPQNRKRGGLPVSQARLLASERLSALGEICVAANTCLVLEPIPDQYGADFLCHAAEVRDLVALCGHAGLGTHLDTACVDLAGDTIASQIAATGAGLRHFHAAEPNLGPFSHPVCDHGAAAAALRHVNYDGWVVIEMREQAAALPAIKAAAGFVREMYGDP
jgi:sugar phosphate isomerase/epimerase